MSRSPESRPTNGYDSATITPFVGAEYTLAQELKRTLYAAEQRDRIVAIMNGEADDVVYAQGGEVVLPSGTQVKILHRGIHFLVEIIECSNPDLVGSLFPASIQTIKTWQNN